MVNELVEIILDHENKIINEMIAEEDEILQATIDESVELFKIMHDADEFRSALMTFVLMQRKKRDADADR